MSRVSNKIFTPSNESESKLPSMPNKPEVLSAFIRRTMSPPPEGKGLTYQQVSDASGGEISANYIHNLAHNYPSRRLAGDKIVALAKGLGESPVLVFCLAQGLSVKLRDEPLQQLLEDYLALPKDEQSELKLMIELLRKEIFERRKRSTAK